MKKYKHIKRGCIAELASHKIDYNITLNGEIEGTLPKWVVENSNDWIELKEYPKIISFRHSNTGTSYAVSTQRVNKNREDINLYGFSGFTVEEGIERGYEIYQVAASQNIVFTVGDKVKYNGKCGYDHFIIDNFYYGNQEDRILARSKSCGFVEDVTTIVKVKEIKRVNYHEGCILCETPQKQCPSCRYYNIPGIRSCCDWDLPNLSTRYLEPTKKRFSIKEIEEALKTSTSVFISLEKFISEKEFKQKLGI